MFLKQWRRHRGLSQRDLADRIGVDRGTISRLERGVSDYTRDRLEGLAQALDCTPADLIGHDPTSTRGKLWSAVRRLRPSMLPIALRILESLTDHG